MKGELKGDAANIAIRNMIAQGIDKVELRDEIYCQLIRQSTYNPNSEFCQRVWSVFSLCAVSFGPSHTLHKVRMDNRPSGIRMNYTNVILAFIITLSERQK